MKKEEFTIDEEWCLVEAPFNVATNRHYESILGLGTGYLSVRSTLDEGLHNDDQSIEYNRFMVNTTLEEIPAQKSRWGTFMPVIGALHPFLSVGMVNLPYFLGLVLEVDGEKLDMEASTIQDYHRWLNLKTATLYRTLTWQTKSGLTVEVAFKRYLDSSERFVCIQECRLKMISGSGQVTVTSFVDNDVRTNGFDKFIQTGVGNDNDTIYSDIETNHHMRVLTASRMVTSQRGGQRIHPEDRKISAVAAFDLTAGEGIELLKASVVVSDQYFNQDTLLQEAISILDRITSTNPAELYARHITFWSERWQKADILIEAQDDDGYDSQKAVRMAIYHLLRGKAADEDRGLVCPKGNLSEVYYGGVFWDMEIFINPFYIYTDPTAARNTPMFRYLNLPAARRRAAHYGYPGAKYPWSSAYNGEEVVVLWEYADMQVHIVSDVVIGLWHYVQATGDYDFLFDYGAEIIVETARYWVERVDVIPGLPGYQIYGVMGPDEYKPLVNNNAYTNYGARFNLELAHQVLTMMEEQVPGKYQDLISRINLEPGEVDRFREIAAGIPIDIDQERDIVWQCDHFETAFAPVDVDTLWKDKTQLAGKLIHQEKRYRSKTAKQGDVIALFSVFPGAFTLQQKQASFDYYLPFTIHDSTCSMVQHILVAADIGRPEQAYGFWKKAIDIDFGRYPKAADGPHFPNVGGMWQDVVFGFCGMQSALNTDILTFKPCLPKQFKRIRFKVKWKGSWVRVTVSPESFTIENLSSEDLAFNLNGSEHYAAAGERKIIRER